VKTITRIMRKFSSSGVKARVAIFATVTLGTVGLVLGTAWAVTMTIEAPLPGFGEVVPPAGVPAFVPLTSLKTVPNPVIPKDPITGQPVIRADLVDYVANLPAAIRLGKALFWEMQAGSDNKTACATCHFHAGADDRDKNQLEPGFNGSWDGFGANQALLPADYPFTIPLVPDNDNATGSQGVRKSTFQGLSKSGAELTASADDPVFNVGGKNVRRVTGKNSPSVVNAVFNHRNFHNGRAQVDFNGVNVWGNRDKSARVWVLDVRGNPAAFVINIQNASLASQAVGPPLNTVEMSAQGRSFPDIGKKLLLAKPLGLQRVSATDSVLGPVADATAGKGLTASYKTLIQTAFQPKWWNSTKSVTVGGKSYTMMQANFALYWGLSIMLYEATLVSDDTPMDQYLDSGRTNAAVLDQVVSRLAAEGTSVTRDDILNGLALFESPVALPTDGVFPTPPPAGSGVGCSLCHVGANTTSASVLSLTGPGLEPAHAALKNAGFDLRMERMFMKLPPVPAGTLSITYDPNTYAIGLPDGTFAPVATYDTGWYNIGVRPTADDPGLGGKDPFGNFLSWTGLFQALADPSFIKVPGGGLGAPIPPAAPATSPFAGEVLNPLTGLPLLAGPLTKTEPTAVAGSFKTAALRNAELTGPYFHNGGKSTLRQAVKLYDDGGNFANLTLHPLIRPLGMTPDQVRGLVAFLVALTDERVRWQKAPFDHPQLFVPDGDSPAGTDATLEIPATGAGGAATPLGRFLGLDPFQP